MHADNWNTRNWSKIPWSKVKSFSCWNAELQLWFCKKCTIQWFRTTKISKWKLDFYTKKLANLHQLVSTVMSKDYPHSNILVTKISEQANRKCKPVLTQHLSIFPKTISDSSLKTNPNCKNTLRYIYNRKNESTIWHIHNLVIPILSAQHTNAVAIKPRIILATEIVTERREM